MLHVPDVVAAGWGLAWLAVLPFGFHFVSLLGPFCSFLDSFGFLGEVKPKSLENHEKLIRIWLPLGCILVFFWLPFASLLGPFGFSGGVLGKVPKCSRNVGF